MHKRHFHLGLHPLSRSWRKYKLDTQFPSLVFCSYPKQSSYRSWNGHVEIFTTQYALVPIRVTGKEIALEVVNPDTLEVIENVPLN
jgi:hypothetical protein